MSEVLFGQSYFLRFDPKLWQAMQPYPPLGTLYAASYIRERGFEVGLFDAMLAESEQEWDQALAREQPRYAVIYEDNFNYLSKMCLLRMRQAAFSMLGMARARGCTVIAAGSDATDHAQEYLDAGADYVLIGEGEETLGELLACLSGGSRAQPSGHLPREGLSGGSRAERSGSLVAEGAPEPAGPPAGLSGGSRAERSGSLVAEGASEPRTLEDILGLAFKRDGQVHVNPRRPDIKDLDALPFPAWELVDIPRYRALWQQRHGYYSMNLVTSRGCPYHCNWCAKPIWGQRYGVRSPGNVAAEMAWLKKTFAPDHIWFADDIFGLKPGWVERFADLVEANDARIPFKSLQRVDLILKGETARALKRAGAQRVWVGAESGSQKILDAMEKGTRVEHIYAAARLLHEVGIEIGFFLQFGYPGETREDIEKTLQMVRDCRPDDIGMSVSYPLPGTRFFAAVQHELGTRQNWLDSNDLAMLYHGPYSTAFYRVLHRRLHREFRAQRAWDDLRPALHRPTRLRKRHLRDLASIVRSRATLPLLRLELDRQARAPHQGFSQLLPVEAAPE